VILLSGRVPGRDLDPPDLASTKVAAYSRFRGKLIGSFRFSRQGEYISGRAAEGSGPGDHTIARRGQGWPTPWGGAAASWHPSVSALDSVTLRKK
jgi:hypothetical protein